MLEGFECCSESICLSDDCVYNYSYYLIETSINISIIKVAVHPLLKPLDEMRCHLAGKLVVTSNSVVGGLGTPTKRRFGGQNPQSEFALQTEAKLLQ